VLKPEAVFDPVPLTGSELEPAMTLDQFHWLSLGSSLK